MEETLTENFTIHWEMPNDVWLDFKAYFVTGRTEDGSRWYGENAACAEPQEVFAVGFLKWDGCNEWEFGDDMHFCNPHDLPDYLREITEALTTIAEGHMRSTLFGAVGV